MAASVDHLFVYGTLRRGSPHPMARRLAGGARHAGMGTIAGVLYDLDSFPGAALSPGSNGRIVGDLYLLREPSALLRALDRYETGGDTENPCFARVAASVTRGDAGRRVMAWVYCVVETPLAPRIVGGDWLAYRRRHERSVPKRRAG